MSDLTDKYRLPQQEKFRTRARNHPPKRATEPFIKGPIPLRWLSYASKISGKALSVGMALWYLSGMTCSKTVALSHKALAQFGVSVRTAQRLYPKMAAAGLIRIEQNPGNAPRITIVGVKGE